jgi:predicted esterase
MNPTLPLKLLFALSLLQLPAVATDELPRIAETFEVAGNKALRYAAPKPILLGQSRGGIMTLAWAFRHPDKLRAWVGIYPVCNLASWPLKNSKAQTLADFAMPEAELVARLKEFNPVDNVKGLLENKVPMFAVHGDSDLVVPYDDNTKLLKERYEAGGGRITVKLVPGEGHQATPAFFECPELVEFVLKHAASPPKQ